MRREAQQSRSRKTLQAPGIMNDMRRRFPHDPAVQSPPCRSRWLQSREPERMVSTASGLCIFSPVW